MVILLKIKNLNVNYGDKKVLKKLNMNIAKGEIQALIGPSGSGKSTLLKTIAGINDISGGSIEISGKILSPKTHTIGYIPQDFGLLKWKTVRENISIGALIKKISPSDSFDDIVNELGIKKLLNSYPNELSGGEKQRVAIARALLIEPDILLMDEPFSALDSYTKESAINLILNIWKKHKVTCLIVTHDIESAIYLGEKIIVMNKMGCIEDVKENKLFSLAYTQNFNAYKEMLELLKPVNFSEKECEI